MKLNGVVVNGGIPHHHDDMSLTSSGNTVEEVVLQTQVETLQWQLNQVRFYDYFLLGVSRISATQFYIQKTSLFSPCNKFNKNSTISIIMKSQLIF